MDLHTEKPQRVNATSVHMVALYSLLEYTRALRTRPQFTSCNCPIFQRPRVACPQSQPKCWTTPSFRFVSRPMEGAGAALGYSASHGVAAAAPAQAQRRTHSTVLVSRQTVHVKVSTLSRNLTSLWSGPGPAPLCGLPDHGSGMQCLESTSIKTVPVHTARPLATA